MPHILPTVKRSRVIHRRILGALQKRRILYVGFGSTVVVPQGMAGRPYCKGKSLGK